MAQVSDLLVDYTTKQANSFVNTVGTFPKLIKFDYLGKYSLKGKTRLLIEVGLEIETDFTYFNTGYTWVDSKRKYYITNFGCYRTNLVPGTGEDEGFFSKCYELIAGENGQVNVDLIRHEITHYFLPYLERLNTLNDLVSYLHWHKPDEEEMRYAYQNHSYFYNWLTVIYLLITEGRVEEAEFSLEKIIHITYSLDQTNPHYRFSEGLFEKINKLQQDFALNHFYKYDAEQRRIVVG